jgi:hypothetical protein
MADKIADKQPGLSSPARDMNVVTLSDSDQSEICKSFEVTVPGTMKITTYAGREISRTWPAGIYPLSVKRFWSTGTDAAMASAVFAYFD